MAAFVYTTNISQSLPSNPFIGTAALASLGVSQGLITFNLGVATTVVQPS